MSWTYSKLSAREGGNPASRRHPLVRRHPTWPASLVVLRVSWVRRSVLWDAFALLLCTAPWAKFRSDNGYTSRRDLLSKARATAATTAVKQPHHPTVDLGVPKPAGGEETHLDPSCQAPSVQSCGVPYRAPQRGSSRCGHLITQKPWMKVLQRPASSPPASSSTSTSTTASASNSRLRSA